MTYRKFKADYLFTGKETADHDSVLITTPEGMVQDIVPAAEAGSDVAYYPGWLTPGFINCHCHLELSHLRGVLPEGTGLVDFLSSVIRRRGGDNGNAAEAMAAAEQEMLDKGIVAVGDICNTTDSLPVKTKGRMEYRNFIEAIGFIDQGAQMRFAGSKAVFDQFEAVFPGKNAIVPHAPYSVSPTLFRMITGHPAARLLSMHNQETGEENDFFLTGKGDFLRLYELLGVDVSFFQGTGKRSLESVLPYFHKDQSLILVHNVATTAADLLDIQAQQGPSLYFCLCPNANRYISGRLPDVELLRRSGVMLVLGTDSLASNHQLDIVAEMKTLQEHFPQVETATLLEWATVNGAEALGLGSVLGSFGKGTRPGVVSISNVDRGRLTADSRAQRLL
jgi:cytosine/adenosine deaminase-related metal-dependent hydrolase